VTFYATVFRYSITEYMSFSSSSSSSPNSCRILQQSNTLRLYCSTFYWTCLFHNMTACRAANVIHYLLTFFCFWPSNVLSQIESNHLLADLLVTNLNFCHVTSLILVWVRYKSWYKKTRVHEYPTAETAWS